MKLCNMSESTWLQSFWKRFLSFLGRRTVQFHFLQCSQSKEEWNSSPKMKSRHTVTEQKHSHREEKSPFETHLQPKVEKEWMISRWTSVNTSVSRDLLPWINSTNINSISVCTNHINTVNTIQHVQLKNRNRKIETYEINSIALSQNSYIGSLSPGARHLQSQFYIYIKKQ